MLTIAFLYNVDTVWLTTLFTAMQTGFLAVSYLFLNVTTWFVDLTAPFTAALAYFFVPSVHERFNTWIARARGIDPNEATSSQPKAMIFPSRVPETDKNTVHAKGAVQNISNDALENLALDVQLNKCGGETEMINVPVTPAQLAPNDQGNYAFDYDGKGVMSYTIKRLSSNGREVRFTAPGQK